VDVEKADVGAIAHGCRDGRRAGVRFRRHGKPVLLERESDTDARRKMVVGDYDAWSVAAERFPFVPRAVGGTTMWEARRRHFSFRRR
jgi:hypothetical protein